jgi:hypothetical protein
VIQSKERETDMSWSARVFAGSPCEKVDGGVCGQTGISWSLVADEYGSELCGPVE